MKFSHLLQMLANSNWLYFGSKGQWSRLLRNEIWLQAEAWPSMAP